jgi:hypothetical protein
LARVPARPPRPRAVVTTAHWPRDCGGARNPAALARRFARRPPDQLARCRGRGTRRCRSRQS